METTKESQPCTSSSPPDKPPRVERLSLDGKEDTTKDVEPESASGAKVTDVCQQEHTENPKEELDSQQAEAEEHQMQPHEYQNYYDEQSGHVYDYSQYPGQDSKYKLFYVLSIRMMV